MLDWWMNLLQPGAAQGTQASLAGLKFIEKDEVERRAIIGSYFEVELVSLTEGFDENEGIERRGIIGSYLEVLMVSLTG
jgi:hypothetical protein